MVWQPRSKTIRKYITQVLSNIAGSLGCCDLCGENVNQSELFSFSLAQNILCQHCVNDLPYFKQEIVSGNLLSWPAIHSALPDIHFERLFSLSPYLYPFDQWLAQLKYLGRFELAPVLSTLLCAQWQTSNKNVKIQPVDLVIPVPLHVKKWQSRGYNQAHLIGKSFAKQLALNYDATLVTRIKNNDSQMGKTGKQRRQNLANAFSLQKILNNNIKHIMLIDDVVTTGTTASEISKLLKKAGVETVTLVTVCLTLP